ncbi:MAG: thioredoxin family protein [Candidatus Methanoperedens sp.]|nr:thioredoxin family protein [Candidatus Methanoperedens sp.]CAG0995178.1 Thioredoxin [Methanosarcinales archaeon]
MAKGELKDIKGDLEDILKTKKQTFVLFYASWCSFCRAFLPIYDRYFEKQPETFLRIMIDEREELMDRYSVEIVPTVIFFAFRAVGRCQPVAPGTASTCAPVRL